MRQVLVVRNISQQEIKTFDIDLLALVARVLVVALHLFNALLRVLV
jgi:hypothetical protein